MASAKWSPQRDAEPIPMPRDSMTKERKLDEIPYITDEKTPFSPLKSDFCDYIWMPPDKQWNFLMAYYV